MRHVLAGRLSALWVISFLSIAAVPFVPLFAQQETDPQAVNLYGDAANAQNNGAYELASEEWKQFLAKYPKSPLADKAQHYLGVCLLQLKPPKYEEAAKAFAVIVGKIPQNKEFAYNEDAYLNLGWCQYSLARQKPADAAKWNQQAAATFAGMVKQYPEGKFADQALYFQGEALYALNKLDEAIVPYAKLVADHPKSSLRSSGLYALGVTYEEVSQYAKAGGTYDLFLEEFPDDGLATEVRMRKGETVLQAGLALKKENKSAEAKSQFAAAAKLFADAAAAPKFKLADHALYREAYCALEQEKFNEAGDLYAKVAADFPKSTYLRDATMSAGRAYYRGEQFAKAADAFQKLIDLEGANPPDAKNALAPEAAHWLCRMDLKSSPPQPKHAEELAKKVIPNAAGSEYLVELLMDQADAVYDQTERKAESIPLYLKIAADYAQKPVGPRALYNAAFAEMELQKYDEGLKHAGEFLTAYASDPLAPDVKFVAAECKLFLKQYPEAEAAYKELIAASPKHPEVPAWQVRLGLCLYLEKKYDETVALMSPLAGTLPQPSQKAEANFLVGASNFFLDKFAEAVPELEAALATDPKWYKADEALLLLSQALHKQGKNAEAIAAVKRLIGEHAGSKLLDQAHFRYGDFAYTSGDYATAVNECDRVIADFPESEYAPYAVNRKGWSQLKEQKWTEAAATFTTFVDKYPQHQLFSEVLLARGMCRRQAKDYKGAVEDLNAFLAKKPASADDVASALYERGLAETALGENEEAAASFETLVKDNPKWSAADGALYNLGWTYRALKQPDKAVATFGKLSTDHPDSQYAAEAFFHVGESLYDKEQWAEAKKQYALAKEKAGDNKQVGERAVYKLGWACYKADEFDPALKEFSEQVTKYPAGDLLTDGLFMKGECLFKLENYTEALPVYKAANAAAAKSDNVAEAVKTLILLHGGQSAVQLKQWNDALPLLTSLVESYKDSPLVADAKFEIGVAQKNQGKTKEAMLAWEEAATLSRGEVGAKARFEMGEYEFGAKQHDEAVKHFQRVMFGYGGDDAPPEVKRWQAKSGVEAGRCAEVQIESAQGAARTKLIADAKRFYTYVVEKHEGETKLAEFAKMRLVVLAKLQ